MRRNHTRQRGIALVTVLLVVMIATIAASAMVARQFYDIRRTGNVLDHEQALLVAYAVEEFAMRVLEEDANGGNTDSITEVWAVPMESEELGGKISGQIEDLNARININDVVNQKEEVDELVRRRLERLINKVQEKNRETLPPEALVQEKDLVDAIVDWIDKNDQVSGYEGAEDMHYLNLEHPYMAANAPMASISELRLVKGMTPQLFALLEPSLAALPRGKSQARINVNTAPPEVLAACFDKLKIDEAEPHAFQENESVEKFTDDLDQAGFRYESNPNLNTKAEKEYMSVASEYFKLSTTATFGNATVQMYSVLYRDKQKKKVSVIMRSQGSY
ncbi:MAG: type II secretion system minor pseudopilin GspK [Pseudomonadota bacterium]